MDSKTKFLADKATHYANDICDHNAGANWYEVRDAKFAELIREEMRKLYEPHISPSIVKVLRERGDE